MTEPFTKREIEKASENLLWAQGLINYVLRTGAILEEAESIAIFYILEMLLKDAINIFDPLSLETVFPQMKTNESDEEES